MIKIIFILALLVMCESVLYSSFWEPLFNPQILNYRVDINYDPDGDKNAQKEYARKFGYRGEKLIDDLGKGEHPGETDEKVQYNQKYNKLKILK